MALLRDVLEKQKFYPGILGVFVNPFFFARRELMKNISKCSVLLHGKLLDVGCGRKPYKRMFRNVTEYIGMDIENPGHDHSEEDIDVFYDGKIFPFPDHHFDSVLTNQVLEHVFNPTEFLSEINRVLKPNGYLLLTVPFIWDEHEQPFDYGRYSSFGIKHILVQNNFQVLEYSKSCQGTKAIFQLINLHIYKKFFSKNRLLRLILTILLISPFTILGISLSWFGKANSDLFLDNVVLARKVN
ncbi:MAG TPA: class I SAM-dependent methyltransferase [Cyclobacteriaceae bacterium]|nr:class I SAM-dependent methyltransferase [Cyclobacteriaceae bacterium]